MVRTTDAVRGTTGGQERTPTGAGNQRLRLGRVTTALLTDKYELTMLAAALRDGTAAPPHDVRGVRPPTARGPPLRRRRGHRPAGGSVAAVQVRRRRAGACSREFLDPATLAYLADYRFSGDIDGYPEGELYFPGSPVLSVHGTFAECVLLETLALSILNHDSAIASAAARMVSAADGRPLIEMGSRRTHEQAAVAAARAAYIAGFAASSNLEAQRRYGVPALRHQRPRLHAAAHHAPTGPTSRPRSARRSTRSASNTTLLVDTYDITTGVANAVAAAGPELGAVRIDSGDLGVLARQVRAQLDDLGATNTRIVVSGDLDEFAIAALRAEPVDIYGVGTSLVTGSGAPTAGMVYKLVEVDGMPVEKRSSHKESHGGRKQALRLAKASGTIVEEVVHPADEPPAAPAGLTARDPGRSAGPRGRRGRPTSVWPPPASASPRDCTACRGTA